MRLTLTKTEIAIVQKLVIDRKRDIHNAGGDSKQYEMLSKLNKKRQSKNILFASIKKEQRGYPEINMLYN